MIWSPNCIHTPESPLLKIEWYKGFYFLFDKNLNHITSYFDINDNQCFYTFRGIIWGKDHTNSESKSSFFSLFWSFRGIVRVVCVLIFKIQSKKKKLRKCFKIYNELIDSVQKWIHGMDRIHSGYIMINRSIKQY